MTFVTSAALQDVVAMDVGGLVISAALSCPILFLPRAHFPNTG